MKKYREYCELTDKQQAQYDKLVSLIEKTNEMINNESIDADSLADYVVFGTNSACR